MGEPITWQQVALALINTAQTVLLTYLAVQVHASKPAPV